MCAAFQPSSLPSPRPCWARTVADGEGQRVQVQQGGAAVAADGGQVAARPRAGQQPHSRRRGQQLGGAAWSSAGGSRLLLAILALRTLLSDGIFGSCGSSPLEAFTFALTKPLRNHRQHLAQLAAGSRCRRRARSPGGGSPRAAAAAASGGHARPRAAAAALKHVQGDDAVAGGQAGPALQAFCAAGLLAAFTLQARQRRGEGFSQTLGNTGTAALSLQRTHKRTPSHSPSWSGTQSLAGLPRPLPRQQQPALLGCAPAPPLLGNCNCSSRVSATRLCCRSHAPAPATSSGNPTACKRQHCPHLRCAAHRPPPAAPTARVARPRHRSAPPAAARQHRRCSQARCTPIIESNAAVQRRPCRFWPVGAQAARARQGCWRRQWPPGFPALQPLLVHPIAAIRRCYARDAPRRLSSLTWQSRQPMRRQLARRRRRPRCRVRSTRPGPRAGRRWH